MKKNKHITGKRILMGLVMLAAALVALFPFYSMLMMGTYKTTELYSSIKLLPGDYLLQNLKRVMNTPILTFYRNSLIVAVCSSLMTVFVCSLAGYVLAVFSFKGKHGIVTFIMLTMMIPQQLGIVGFLMEMRRMHLINTLAPLILPFSASAFGVFWIKQFAQSAIPYEVVEMARLEGASEFMIYRKIAMPFMRPACVTLLLLAFLWSWNDFMYPLVILNKTELYTIPLGIRMMSGAYANDTAAQILGLSMTTLPILLLFIAFNKSMIEGLTSSSVKG